jgi:hypothetical protein
MVVADLMPNGRLGAPADSFWPASPYRLVSLLEMLEFNAAWFVDFTNRMSSMNSILDQGELADVKIKPAPALPGDESAVQLGRVILNGLVLVEEKCQSLGLDSALAQIARIRRELKADCPVPEFRRMIDDLIVRIHDQLNLRLFLFVPTERAKFYSGQQLFGADVEVKFPDASYDISEAGKCLAVNRSTATVCHLMRVLDVGLKALANHLTATIDTDQPWGRILPQVDAAIQARSLTGVNVDDLNKVHASLNAVRVAWRNSAMHCKDKYTEEEAEEIFNACKTFMRLLAQVI